MVKTTYKHLQFYDIMVLLADTLYISSYRILMFSSSVSSFNTHMSNYEHKNKF